ncbi:MAG: hypothetical protein KJ655_01890 [Candidatus Thermoplasmatota archaeon]|nr:hypothetical protein [Candidatus Thermoplasmatota archaeon]
MEGLKCVCGKTAKRVDDIEYKGLKFNGWRCKCSQEMVDPYQANLYLKFKKLKKEGKTAVKLRKVGNTFVLSISRKNAESIFPEILGKRFQRFP